MNDTYLKEILTELNSAICTLSFSFGNVEKISDHCAHELHLLIDFLLEELAIYGIIWNSVWSSYSNKLWDNFTQPAVIERKWAYMDIMSFIDSLMVKFGRLF